MSCYECKCKYCKYINSSECDGYKWYCELFHRFEDPDETKECKEYQKA